MTELQVQFLRECAEKPQFARHYKPTMALYFAGLIEVLVGGMYRITPAGRAMLDEIDRKKEQNK